MQPAQQHKGNEGNLYHPASDKVMIGSKQNCFNIFDIDIFDIKIICNIC